MKFGKKKNVHSVTNKLGLLTIVMSLVSANMFDFG